MKDHRNLKTKHRVRYYSVILLIASPFISKRLRLVLLLRIDWFVRESTLQGELPGGSSITFRTQALGTTRAADSFATGAG
jgi:hypothetical protein